MNKICTIYREVEVVHKASGHTLSGDEMTGNHTLEHKYTNRPTVPGKVAGMNFEYIRHGMTSLISVFDVFTGYMETPNSNATHIEEDLIAALRTLVEMYFAAS